MVPVANCNWQTLLDPASTTNGATQTSAWLDTKGYDYATIAVLTTASNNVTNKPATLKVRQADDTNSPSDLTAFVGGGTGGFTIPNETTAAKTGPYAIFNIDTRGTQRYLEVLWSPVTTQTATIIALLSRAEQSPVGAAGLNATIVVTG